MVNRIEYKQHLTAKNMSFCYCQLLVSSAKRKIFYRKYVSNMFVTKTFRVIILDEVYNQIKNEELKTLVMDFCTRYTSKTIYILNCKSTVYQYRKLNKHITRIVIFY